MASDANTANAVGLPNRWWASSADAIGGPTTRRLRREVMGSECRRRGSVACHDARPVRDGARRPAAGPTSGKLLLVARRLLVQVGVEMGGQRDHRGVGSIAQSRPQDQGALVVERLLPPVLQHEVG